MSSIFRTCTYTDVKNTDPAITTIYKKMGPPRAQSALACLLIIFNLLLTSKTATEIFWDSGTKNRINVLCRGNFKYKIRVDVSQRIVLILSLGVTECIYCFCGIRYSVLLFPQCPCHKSLSLAIKSLLNSPPPQRQK